MLHSGQNLIPICRRFFGATKSKSFLKACVCGRVSTVAKQSNVKHNEGRVLKDRSPEDLDRPKTLETRNAQINNRPPRASIVQVARHHTCEQVRVHTPPFSSSHSWVWRTASECFSGTSLMAAWICGAWFLFPTSAKQDGHHMMRVRKCSAVPMQVECLW